MIKIVIVPSLHAVEIPSLHADNLVDRAAEGRHWNATTAENNSAKSWRDWFVLFAFGTACGMGQCRLTGNKSALNRAHHHVASWPHRGR
jgi:hypothetical protein